MIKRRASLPQEGGTKRLEKKKTNKATPGLLQDNPTGHATAFESGERAPIPKHESMFFPLISDP